MAFNMYGYNNGQWGIMARSEIAPLPIWNVYTLATAYAGQGFLDTITGENMQRIMIVVDEGVSAARLFDGATQLDFFDGIGHDFKNATDVTNMFANSGVTSVRNMINLESAQGLSYMFNEARGLAEIKNIKVHQGSVAQMFGYVMEDCEIYNIDLSGATDTILMFARSPIKYIKKGMLNNMHNVKSVRAMFQHSRVKDIEPGSMDTSNVEDFSLMFGHGGPMPEDDAELRAGAIDTRSAKNMQSMFHSSYFKKINLDIHGDANVEEMFGQHLRYDLELSLNVEHTTSLIGMFKNYVGGSLNEGDIYNMHNILTLERMFENVSGINLHKIHLKDLEKVEDVTNMFARSGFYSNGYKELTEGLILEGLGAAEQPNQYKRTLDLSRLEMPMSAMGKLAESLAETSTANPWRIITPRNLAWWDRAIAEDKGWIVEDAPEIIPEAEE